MRSPILRKIDMHEIERRYGNQVHWGLFVKFICRHLMLIVTIQWTIAACLAHTGIDCLEPWAFSYFWGPFLAGTLIPKHDFEGNSILIWFSSMKQRRIRILHWMRKNRFKTWLISVSINVVVLPIILWNKVLVPFDEFMHGWRDLISQKFGATGQHGFFMVVGTCWAAIAIFQEVHNYLDDRKVERKAKEIGWGRHYLLA